MRTFEGLGGHLKGCLPPHRVSSKPCVVKTENRALTHKEDKMLVRHRTRDSVLGRERARDRRPAQSCYYSFPMSSAAPFPECSWK